MSLIRPSPPDDKARQRRCCPGRPARGPGDRLGGVLAETKGAPVGRVAGEPPGSDATGPERLLRRLGELGIAAPTVPYPAHRTVEQGRQRRGALAGAFTKNLLLQDKKGRLFLFTVAEDRVLDLRTAHTRVGARGRLGLASADRMREVLGVEPGALTPLALINDQEGLVTAVVDAALLTAGQVNVHPLVNTQSTGLRPADLLAFVHSCGREALIVEFGP